MVKSSQKRSVFGSDANRFESIEPVDRQLRCAWRGCDLSPFMDIPVCLTHALMISNYVREGPILSLKDDDPASFDEDGTPVSFDEDVSQPVRQGVVYYLMVGPSTVKIGTTGNLPVRLRGLRTDLQYVVAIEHGDYALEHQRHQQFAAERIGRREDFRLSERLKRHIDELAPQRDELIRLATT